MRTRKAWGGWGNRGKLAGAGVGPGKQPKPHPHGAHSSLALWAPAPVSVDLAHGRRSSLNTSRRTQDKGHSCVEDPAPRSKSRRLTTGTPPLLIPTQGHLRGQGQDTYPLRVRLLSAHAPWGPSKVEATGGEREQGVCPESRSLPPGPCRSPASSHSPERQRFPQKTRTPSSSSLLKDPLLQQRRLGPRIHRLWCLSPCLGLLRCPHPSTQVTWTNQAWAAAQAVIGTPRATPAQCPWCLQPSPKAPTPGSAAGTPGAAEPSWRQPVCGFSRSPRSPGRCSWSKVPEAWEAETGRAALLGLLGHGLFVGSQSEQLPQQAPNSRELAAAGSG